MVSKFTFNLVVPVNLPYSYLNSSLFSKIQLVYSHPAITIEIQSTMGLNLNQIIGQSSM